MNVELRNQIRNYKKSKHGAKVAGAEEIKIAQKIQYDYDISLKCPFDTRCLNLANGTADDPPISTTPHAIAPAIEATPDPFAECYGDGVIFSLMGVRADADWLTGLFLAQEIITKIGAGKFYVDINTWHAGCRSELVRGFEFFCSKSRYAGKKRINWNWLGADIAFSDQKSTAKIPNVLVGTMGNGDVSIGSNIIYFSNEMITRLARPDVVFYDIYPTKKILISGLVATFGMSNSGYIVCRLPDPREWDLFVEHVAMIYAMIFCSVVLWIPPWGRRAGQPKYYLIACGKKETIYKNNISYFLRYLRGELPNRLLKPIAENSSRPENSEWSGTWNNIRAELLEGDLTDNITPWIRTIAECFHRIE